MLPPKDRTKKQLRALQREVQRTIKALDKSYPDTDKSEDVLHAHRVRVSVLLNQRKTIKLRYDPRGNRELPYPLTPITIKDVLLILVVFLVCVLGLWGFVLLLHWLGTVTGW